MLMRPDIAHELGRVGWRAVATLPAAMPVCALALFPGDDQELPLANCQSSLAKTPPAGRHAHEALTDTAGEAMAALVRAQAGTNITSPPPFSLNCHRFL
jgi:hypothetical protein